MNFKEYFKNEVKKYELDVKNMKYCPTKVVYFMGHEFEVKRKTKFIYLKDKNNLISGHIAYKQLFPQESGVVTYTIYTKNFQLSNKELDCIIENSQDYEFDSQWCTNIILYTKEQIFNYMKKFSYYEFLDILDIYRELTEDDLNQFIKKERCIIGILAEIRQMNLTFWEPYLAEVFSNKYYLEDFLQRQILNDNFILDYLKLFDKNHINIILQYQKNHISEEIYNKLNVYNKLLGVKL